MPFSKSESLPGSGTNLTYDFNHLAELAVAMELIGNGIKPGDVAALLTTRRSKLRPMYVEAYERRDEVFCEDHPDLPMTQGLFLYLWVFQEGGKALVRGPKLLTPPEAAQLVLNMGRAVCSRFIIALSALLDRHVNLALEVPQKRRGRPPSQGTA